MRRHEQKRITVKEEDNTGDLSISEYYRIKIRSNMSYYYSKSLPSNFDWRLVVNHGKDRGKLSTRLARLAGVKGINSLRADLRNTILNAIEDTKRGKLAYIDWTFDINWQRGDFGDPRSCYWPTSGGYVQSMLANGVGAVRVYVSSDMSEKTGIARAWMAIDQPAPYIVTIYNRYGIGNCGLFAKFVSLALNQLGYGEYEYALTRVTKSGSAHINGDAAALWNKDMYPNGIRHVKQNDYVVLELNRNNI